VHAVVHPRLHAESLGPRPQAAAPEVTSVRLVRWQRLAQVANPWGGWTG
jgi:hypothetical protein